MYACRHKITTHALPDRRRWNGGQEKREDGAVEEKGERGREEAEEREGGGGRFIHS